MNLKAEIELLKIELDNVEDHYLIETIKNLLAYGKSKRYENILTPMSVGDFLQRQEMSRKYIEEKTLISQEEAKTYFTNKFTKQVE